MNFRQRLSNKSFTSIEQTRDELELLLVIRQQPKHCRVLIKGEKVGRRPLEPAPVIQLIGRNKKVGDNNKDYLYSPNLFMKAIVEAVDLESTSSSIDSQKNSMFSSSLAFGCLVSSVQTIKDLDKSDVSFFVFPNISIKHEGVFRLRFELYDLINNEISKISSIIGDSFVISSADKFPGWEKTTSLTHLLSSQGVKVNLRKRNHVTIHNSKNLAKVEIKSDQTQSKKPKKESKSKENKKSKPSPILSSSTSSISVYQQERYNSSKKIKIAPQTVKSTQSGYLLYQPKELHYFPLVFTQCIPTSLSPQPFSSPSSPLPTTTIKRDQMTDAKLLLSLCNGLSSPSSQESVAPPKPKGTLKVENISSQLPSFFDLLNSIRSN